MKKWISYLITFLFIALLVGAALFLGGDLSSSDSSQAEGSNVPSYVLEVLHYVKEHGKAPDGYVGGRKFHNREKLLPKTEEGGKKIRYREWDVHKKVKGKNRGAERLVTGSDEQSYYTKDHYRSFIKIKENQE